jgi:hypothetical protein
MRAGCAWLPGSLHPKNLRLKRADGVPDRRAPGTPFSGEVPAAGRGDGDPSGELLGVFSRPIPAALA